MYIIGLDIGTTKVAGALFILPENKVEKVISITHNAQIESINSWEHIQNPNKILEIVESILCQLYEFSDGNVTALGISSQMHGILYVDSKGNSLSPLYTWLDRRGTNVVEQIYKLTGETIYSGYGLATHYYNYKNCLTPKNEYKITTIGGYISMKLSNKTVPCIDPSEGASIGLFNINNRCFNKESIIKLFGSTSFLPKEVPFYFNSGINKWGTKIIQSLGDNQASFMGAMAQNINDLLINVGTSGQISFLSNQIPENLKGIEVRPYPNKNLIVGSTLTGGKSYALLVDLFYDVLTVFNSQLDKNSIFETLANLDISKSINPLEVTSTFNGTRADPKAKGAIKNISLNNLNTKNLVYGFTKAIMMELKDLYTTNKLNKYIEGKNIIGSGNAIRSSELLRSLISDGFNKNLVLLNNIEEAAFGAALYAYKGIVDSLIISLPGII